MEWNLMNKTMFEVNDIFVKRASLEALSASVARVLDLKPGEVMVVEARDDFLAFDILKAQVECEKIVAKEEEILAALSGTGCVDLTDTSNITSDGVLGFISLPKEDAAEIIERSTKIAREIKSKVAKRAVVFSTGAEVIDGTIKDTNSPYLVSLLEEAGIKAVFGGVLPDNKDAVTDSLKKAVDEKYNLVITTGGVGAQKKDCTIDALVALDPDACTPSYLKFDIDNHRHHRNEVRVGVGTVGNTTVIALPGPHDEVLALGDILQQGIVQAWNKSDLADRLANVLQKRWSAKMKQGNGLT